MLISMSSEERAAVIDELWLSGAIAAPVVRAMLSTVGRSLSEEEHAQRWMRPLLEHAPLSFVCRLVHRTRRLRADCCVAVATRTGQRDWSQSTRGESTDVRLRLLLAELGPYLDGSSLFACTEVCSSWYEALGAGCGWCNNSVGQQLLALDLALHNRGASRRHADDSIASYFASRLRTLEALTCVVPETVHEGGLHVLPLLAHLTSLRSLHIDRFTLPKYGDGIPSLDTLVHLETLYICAFTGDSGSSGDRSFRLPPLPMLVDCTLYLG